MIDNVTVHIMDRAFIQKNILSNQKFNPMANIESQNGVVKTEYAQIENMRIRPTKTFTEMKGSLHTLFNILQGIGVQNWDTFSFSNIQNVISYLEETLSVKDSAIKVTNFEAGFNLFLPQQQTPTDILTNNHIMYQYKYPCEDHKNNRHMKMLKFVYENYIQKMYDKSKQYSLSQNILRMEIVYRCKDIFKPFAISILDDFREKDVYLSIFEDFMRRFDRDLLIVDAFELKSITKMRQADWKKLIQYTHPAFWMGLEIRLKCKQISYSNISKLKKEVKALVKKYGLDSTKKELKNLLMESFSTLINS